jgi:hypothetical protein
VGAVVGGLAGKGVAEKTERGMRDTHVMRVRSTRVAEPFLERDYDKYKGNSNLSWENAKLATRDAWHRVEKKLPGDADGDGI